MTDNKTKAKATETVSNHSVRSIRIDEERIDYTKEYILQIVNEHPEHKLW